jgi:sterol desaturase/sphingolipid hydroxylase (fatty acid hydroxylase superfamily)
MSKAFIRYGYVPAMIVGLNGIGYWLVASGQSYWWLALVLAAATAFSFAAERILPAQEAWNHGTGDGATNVFHIAAYEASALNAIAMMPLVAWLTPWDSIWPHHWPLWAELLIAVLFVDLVFTLVHFVSHHHPLLWRLHAVHHGVPRMYGFNGFVRHPLHQSIDTVLGTLPLALAGMPVDVAFLLGLAVSIQLLVQHSNVDFRLGPLDGHLSIGRLHHLHHVNWGRDGDVNFGLFLTVWDRMLGTLQLEPGRPIGTKDLGLDSHPNFPRDYLSHLLFPFLPDRFAEKPGAPTASTDVAAERKDRAA